MSIQDTEPTYAGIVLHRNEPDIVLMADKAVFRTNPPAAEMGHVTGASGGWYSPTDWAWFTSMLEGVNRLTADGAANWVRPAVMGKDYANGVASQDVNLSHYTFWGQEGFYY